MTQDDIERTKRRLMTVLQRVAPDLVAQLWEVDNVRELPRDIREAIADVLGRECAERGLDEDDELNPYGEELDALIDALGLEPDNERG